MIHYLLNTYTRNLTTVPPLATAQTFCASRNGLTNSGFLWAAHTYTRTFFEVYSCTRKADLSKDYRYPKRKLGVTRHFSEITDVQFYKKKNK